MQDPSNQQNPWLATRTRTGAEYDAPYEERAQQGIDVHGEANFIDELLATNSSAARTLSVLDAGCGTGRTAIELARRGYDVVGVDLDEVMLSQARSKAPEMVWHQADLATLALGRRFDAIVMTGNVMIYLTPGTEAAVMQSLVQHLKPNGLLVAAFELNPYPWTDLTIDGYDALAANNGLVRVARYATWDKDDWRAADLYAVSVHRKDA